MQPLEPSKLEGQALTEHINQMNMKILRNEPVSDDEIRAAILALRPHRKHASSTSGAGKKAAAPAMSSDDILALFDKPSTKPGMSIEQIETKFDEELAKNALKPKAPSAFDFDFGKKE